MSLKAQGGEFPLTCRVPLSLLHVPALTDRNTHMNTHPARCSHTFTHVRLLCAQRTSSERERERGTVASLLSTDIKRKWKEIRVWEPSWQRGVCVCVCVRVCLFILAPLLIFFFPVCVSIWHTKCVCVCVCGGGICLNQRGSLLPSAQQLMGNHYRSWQMGSSWLPRQPHRLNPSCRWWCLRNGLLSQPSLSVMASLIGAMHKWIRIRSRLWFRWNPYLHICFFN